MNLWRICDDFMIILWFFENRAPDRKQFYTIIHSRSFAFMTTVPNDAVGFLSAYDLFDL